MGCPILCGALCGADVHADLDLRGSHCCLSDCSWCIYLLQVDTTYCWWTSIVMLMMTKQRFTFKQKIGSRRLIGAVLLMHSHSTRLSAVYRLNEIIVLSVSSLILILFCLYSLILTGNHWPPRACEKLQAQNTGWHLLNIHPTNADNNGHHSKCSHIRPINVKTSLRRCLAATQLQGQLLSISPTWSPRISLSWY